MTDRETKRDQFVKKTNPRKVWLIPTLLLVIIAAAAGAWLATGAEGNRHRTVTALQDGTLRFAESDFADGKARFFRYQGQNGAIDFFMVRSADGVIRAAFDTCDVCYRERKGYRQAGDAMVCNNCDQQFRTELVNVVKGGCNPVPLNRRQQSEQIVITVKDLESGSGYFTVAAN